MTDKQLQNILDAFNRNDNDIELKTEKYRVVSDHNILAVSFLINDEFIIYRAKGENEKITVSKGLDVEDLLSEIELKKPPETAKLKDNDYEKS